MVASVARGVILVHSSPRALCPHVEWAAGRALGRAVNFSWEDQPVLKGAQRAEYYWEGSPGMGAALASSLRGWEHLRFEVTEDPTAGSDGGRWLHTPDLGIVYAQPSCIVNFGSRLANPGTTSLNRSATRRTTRVSSGCTRSVRLLLAFAP